MPWLLPVIKYRPVLGVVQVVPRRAWRPGGGSTWTTPALRRSYRQGEPPKNKISSIKVSTVRGEPRPQNPPGSPTRAGYGRRTPSCAPR